MKTQVAIVGGAPGGTTSALYLARQGIQSVVVEKEQFPRFHIGESLTGECGNCLRDLGLGEFMASGPNPVKYGVKVYGPQGKHAFWVPVMARSPEGKLVEASTWQIRRSTFDAKLLEHARNQGIGFLHGEAVGVLREGEVVRGVKVKTPDGRMEDLEAEVVIDASGLGTFLCNTGVIGPRERGNYDRQIAIFSHFKGTIRDPGKSSGDTLILYKQKHHWAWFIPIDNEVVSIGIVVPSDYWTGKKESKRDFLMRELRELNPELARRCASAVMVEDARAVSNYSYHIRHFTGRNYLCVGDSHRFVDPVFSFGLYFSIKEAQFAADAVARFLAGEGRDLPNPFQAYEDKAERGIDVIQTLVDAFWSHPLAFAVYAHDRYRDDFIDMFAGRVYMDKPSPGLLAMQELNAQARARGELAG